MARKTSIEEPEELEQELDELEKRLERLRVLYEQYFLGIEKRPPLTLLREVVRLIRRIGNYHIRKTYHKFRFHALAQRFNVHRAYWQRTMREIEEGTYRRDRSRAHRREKARSGEGIDSAELAKRALLLRVKGEEAVEERRERVLREYQEDTSRQREPYVPAVARKRRRRKKRSTEGIRGAPAKNLYERQAELSAATREIPQDAHHEAGSAAPAGSETQPIPPSSMAPPRPPQSPPDDRATPLPPSPFQMASPPVAPPRGSPPRPQSATPPHPAVGNGPAGPSSPPTHRATEVLSNAGVTPERARHIYQELIAARQQCGQPVKNLTYERILESMARQVPKLRASHGAASVDFDVVTKGDKVFLKPKMK